MGAVTVSIKKRDSIGAMHVRFADVTFSSTYTSGGDTFTPGQFELSTVHAIKDCGTVASATTAYKLLPDLVNNKILLMGGAAGSQGVLVQAANADYHTVVARVKIYGDSPYI